MLKGYEACEIIVHSLCNQICNFVNFQEILERPWRSLKVCLALFLWQTEITGRSTEIAEISPRPLRDRWKFLGPPWRLLSISWPTGCLWIYNDRFMVIFHQSLTSCKKTKPQKPRDCLDQHFDLQRSLLRNVRSSFCGLSSEALCWMLRSTCIELQKVYRQNGKFEV